MVKKLSRIEMIELLKKIIDVAGSERQLDEWLYLIRCNVPHPEVGDLIFRTELSAEEIIDRALAYQPVLLGPSSLDSSDQ